MLKCHISIGVFVAYIDTVSPVPNISLKSRDLADENKKTFDGMEMIRNNYWIYNKPFHISDYDSKIICFTELFPFKADKRLLFHVKFNENSIYFSHNQFTFYCLLVNFLFSIK